MSKQKLMVVALIGLLIFVMGFAIVQADPSSYRCGNDVYYTVRFGDTLGKIARAYGTDVRTIAAANGIVNYDLVYAGSRLRIPCGGDHYASGDCFDAVYHQNDPYNSYSGCAGQGVYVPGLPAGRILPGAVYPPIVIDCSTLRITSPRDGLAFGQNTVYVDGVVGATSYRVNIYRVFENTSNVQFVGAFDSAANATRIFADFGNTIGAGGLVFEIEAEALVSDVPVCRTARIRQFREAPDFDGAANGDDNDDDD